MLPIGYIEPYFKSYLKRPVYYTSSQIRTCFRCYERYSAVILSCGSLLVIYKKCRVRNNDLKSYD
jgi:hypothetical protein